MTATARQARDEAPTGTRLLDTASRTVVPLALGRDGRPGGGGMSPSFLEGGHENRTRSCHASPG
jgi:hypothetical protein